MFRAVPMVHLQVQVPSRDGQAVTREIAANGLLHLIDIAHGAVPSVAGAPDVREQLGRFRDLARTIHTLQRLLGVAGAGMAGPLPAPSAAADFAIEYQEVRARLEPVLDAVETAARRRNDGREERARAAAALARAERLRAAGVPADRLRALRFTCVRIGAAAPDDLAMLSGLVAPAPFAIVPLEADLPRPLAAVIVPVSGRERLDAALRGSAFETIDVPAGAGGDDEASLRKRLDAAVADEQAGAAALESLKAQHAPLVLELAARVDVAVLLLQAQTMFATAGRFLVISGWIPEERAAELSAAIARVSEKRAVVTIDKPEALSAAYGAAFKVPILHRNPLLLRPFDRLVQVYGVPSYGEIQPTAFFAMSFLLMFGLMFGDLGHGLVLVAAGYCLFRYIPRFLDYGILLMEAGVASSAFGLLYGSVFGVQTLLPVVVDPLRDITAFGAAAIGFGALLVTAGVVINVVNSWRAGERVAALTGTRGVFGALVYWSALAVAARAVVPAGWRLPDGAVLALFVAAAAILAARPLIVRAFGPSRAARPGSPAPRSLASLEASIEIVDAIFSYFANTISFVRVAAFAAVHAGVFIALFALADTVARIRFGGPLAAFVLVAGNVAVILLEGLTVTVQVLRLEYYEFFSRFFRGGGEPYRPLMLRPDVTAQGGT